MKSELTVEKSERSLASIVSQLKFLTKVWEPETSQGVSLREALANLEKIDFNADRVGEAKVFKALDHCKGN
jgi:hypothetical protein